MGHVGRIHFLHLFHTSSVLCTQLILIADKFERNTECMNVSVKKGQWRMCFLDISGNFNF